jgi:iron complex outermembrane receptor protein/vitamin B12 transporter
VLVGAEWQNEDGNSAGYIDFGFPVPTDYEIDRDTVSAFAEASAELGRFVLQGGLRYDDPDEIDSVTSVRVGLIYRLADDLTEIRANWGDGFKAPSFFVLANPIVGNPDLQPEKAESADLGIKHRFSSGSGAVEFVVFHNEYKDLIDFDDTLFTNVNRDKVITKGAEAAIDLSPLDTLDLRAQVTYLDTDIVDSNEPLRSRPRWRGGLIADWEFVQDWRWVTSVLSLDDFYESSVPTGEVLLGGYTRVDTSVSWQATEALSLGLAVDNLFDKDYQEAVGFPAAGIRGRLGARYKF